MSLRLHELLVERGICGCDTLKPYYPRVRDRADISVLRCERSGVLVLSRDDHMADSHYQDMPGFSYWGGDERRVALASCRADTDRRVKQFGALISNKRWLDIGTGAGAILDALQPDAALTMAVEPQASVRETLRRLGYDVFASLDDVPRDEWEVVTLFHVFEHLTEPIHFLEQIRGKLAPGGRVVLEVPHARDVLLETLNVEAFKAFTFWSEHLILHTRQSLTTFLEASGFRVCSIQGVQRYPLANHLHWLAREKPGGHLTWCHMRTPELDTAYEAMLAKLDQTDTLVAVACKD